MINTYMNWQGTYFSMFIQALLSPINNFGLSQLRIVMIFNAILFWGCLIILLVTFLKKINCNLCIKFSIVAVIVFSLSTYEAYEEVFYWFSGATSYTYPLSFAMLGIIFYKLYEKTDYKKKRYMIISLIVGFL